MDWISYGKTWLEFYHKDELAKPGIQIEAKDARTGQVTLLLIGDINDLGGVCDDCKGILMQDVVVRYRKIVDLEKGG